jgi:CBS domain-containing protein
MICPSCGLSNLPGQDECSSCGTDLAGESLAQPDTPTRWRVLVDPIASLQPSTIQVQTISRHATVQEALAQMRARGVGYLLAVDADGRLAGILTELDLLMKLPDSREIPQGMLVEDLMTVDPTALNPDAPIAHALHFMALDGTTYIPVVDDDGRPCDMLSFRRLGRLFERLE